MGFFSTNRTEAIQEEDTVTEEEEEMVAMVDLDGAHPAVSKDTGDMEDRQADFHQEGQPTATADPKRPLLHSTKKFNLS